MDEDWLSAPYSLKGKKVWIAGHSGMVGRAMMRRLQNEECVVFTLSRDEVDLTSQAETHSWIAEHKPDVIIMAAARVGGIQDNIDNPAPFFYENMIMACNVIYGAYQNGIERLLYLGSSCIYPKDTPNPITEKALLSGAYEPTNEAYALAKTGGIKMCEYYRRQYGCDFISAMPCNLYGPYDRFDEQTSHVIPALIKMFYNSSVADNSHINIWGTGNPRREFLHVDDLADALVFLLQNYSSDRSINIGAGQDISIAELADQIAAVAGFEGEIRFDKSRPDGVARKLMDSSRIYNAGWKPKTDLATGLQKIYDWYVRHHSEPIDESGTHEQCSVPDRKTA